MVLYSQNEKLNPDYLNLIAASANQKQCDLCAKDLGHEKKDEFGSPPKS